MICVTLVGNGGNTYTVTVEQPQPQACAVDQLVLVTQQELQIFSPLQMDLEAAVAIGGATLMLWGVAWLFRAARKSLENQTESEL